MRFDYTLVKSHSYLSLFFINKSDTGYDWIWMKFIVISTPGNKLVRISGGTRDEAGARCSFRFSLISPLLSSDLSLLRRSVNPSYQLCLSRSRDASPCIMNCCSREHTAAVSKTGEPVLILTIPCSPKVVTLVDPI